MRGGHGLLGSVRGTCAFSHAAAHARPAAPCVTRPAARRTQCAHDRSTTGPWPLSAPAPAVRRDRPAAGLAAAAADAPPAGRGPVRHPGGRTRTPRAGFTPGLRLGAVRRGRRRMFLKAASKQAQRPFAEAYAAEGSAPCRTALPAPVPAALDPRGRPVGGAGPGARRRTATPPGRGAPTELDAAWTPWRCSPPSLPRRRWCWPPSPTSWPTWRAAGSTYAALPRSGRTSTRPRPSPPGSPTATAGNTLVHTDARDDNFLLAADGRPCCATGTGRPAAPPGSTPSRC